MIREFLPEDIIFIEQVGNEIIENYKFKINPYTKCYVYEENGKIIGFIVFTIMYEKAEIIDVAVMPDYQGKEVGSKLVEAVIKECIKENCESITLEVRISNYKGISFYRKHGFREISTRKSYYRNGEDALVMIKMVI